LIAEAMGLSLDEISRLRTSALLHDIGKIGIPDQVLQKPCRLTGAEFRLIEQHPGIGRRILEGVNGFAPYLDVVELHHENWDGTGYPHGLTGTAVPLHARIVHVADAYDAMTSDRPYRKGMKSNTAISILLQHAGTQFDPTVVEVFAGIAPGNNPAPVVTDVDSTDAESLTRLATRLIQESATTPPV
jgi:HD-GYP domain-containing protein (c-di-GMP phosphodiesterase class II)